MCCQKFTRVQISYEKYVYKNKEIVKIRVIWWNVSTEEKIVEKSRIEPGLCGWRYCAL